MVSYRNWIVNSSIYTISVVISTLFLMVNDSEYGSYHSIIPKIFNSISTIIGVFGIFYLREKIYKYNSFLQWYIRNQYKNWRKVIDNLPVGILIYKNQNIEFANFSASKFLLGHDNESLENIHREIEKNTELRKLIMMNSIEYTDTLIDNKIRDDLSSSLIQHILPNNIKMSFGVNIINSAAETDDIKITILQNNTIYEDFLKTKSDKESIKKYFSMTIHELRNFLHGILGIFEEFNQIFTKIEHREKSDIGINTIKLMMLLINDSLDISQIESNTFRLANVDTNIDDLVLNCMKLMQYNFQAKGIKLKYSTLTNIPKFKCDKNRYMQILLNLLGNAIKFTETGEVNIIVNYDYDERMLITTVKDTGVGIKDEDISKLFNYFSKLEDSCNLNPQGVGIGLHICKILCHAMDGNITLKSIYNVGSEFIYTIKNQASIDIAWTNHSFSRDIVHSKPVDTNLQFLDSYEILVVDDEVICINALITQLKYLGLLCDTALSASKGIGLIQQRIKEKKKGYKVIFVDIHMPIKSGLEMANEIREVFKSHEVKPYIIGVTGDSDEETIINCKKSGINKVMNKPLSRIDAQNLITELRELKIL